MHGIEYRKMLDEPHRQFGVVPCDLPSSELPTRGQVVGRIMKLRVEKMAVRGTDEKHVPVKPIISQVAAEVADIWARSSVPSRRIDRVVTNITALWGKKDDIKRSHSAIRSEVAADMRRCWTFQLPQIPSQLLHGHERPAAALPVAY